MTNKMTKNTKLPAKAQSMIRALTDVVESMDNGDFKLLRLQQAGGFWCYGEDDVEVDEEGHWAINPSSLMTGFIAWSEDGDREGDEMALITDDPILKSELPEIAGAPWTSQVGFNLKGVTGSDEGVEVLYKAGTVGANKAFRAICNEILHRVSVGEVEIVPVVSLDMEGYKNKKAKGKTTYNPIFNISHWMNPDAMPEEAVEEAVEEVVEEKPRGRRRPRREAKAA